MLAATCDLPAHEQPDAHHHHLQAIQITLQKQHAIPQLQHVDEARVRIKACCLDEADFRMSLLEFPELARLPFTPGYVCSGVIEEIGSESLQFAKGDEVVVLIPLDSPHGGCAEFTVQPVINMFPKPSSLSHEDACAVVWSGIQGFTSLHYQLRVKPGDRLLVVTSRACTDLVLSSLAGLFGARLIVATHTPQAYALFTENHLRAPHAATAASGSPSPSSPSSAAVAPLNPLAHILRVVDCSSCASGAAASQAVLAAVMEETGGLGVDGVIDLQYQHDEHNFLDAAARQLTIQQVDAHSADHASAALAPAAAPLTPLSSSCGQSLALSPGNPVSFSTLVQCLAVQGRLLHTTPNLQVDPPLSRQLFMRGASLGYLFAHNWLLGATQRGRFAHVVSEVLSLAAGGTLQASIHSRYPLTGISAAWKTLTTGAHVGKVVVQVAAAQQTWSNSNQRDRRPVQEMHS